MVAPTGRARSLRSIKRLAKKQPKQPNKSKKSKKAKKAKKAKKVNTDKNGKPTFKERTEGQGVDSIPDGIKQVGTKPSGACLFLGC